MTHSGTTITDLVKLVRKVEGPLCSENGILGYSNEEIEDILSTNGIEPADEYERRTR